MQITFNELVEKGISGNINIYENNLLKETIPGNDSKVIVNGKVVTISPATIFKYQTRISVSIDKGTITDTIGNQMAAIDSSKWVFVTTKEIGINDIGIQKMRSIYPNPANKTIHIPFNNSVPVITIINQLGQVMVCPIKSETNREISVDISEFANGVYSVLIDGQFLQIFVKV